MESILIRLEICAQVLTTAKLKVMSVGNISNQSHFRRPSRTIIQVFFILLIFVKNNNAIRTVIRDTVKPNHLFSDDYLMVRSACRQIQYRISDASEVFYPSDEQYFEDIDHYSQSSSTFSICSVEPGTSDDVALIMAIIRQRRIPFAVKGGGHVMNPKFSSTKEIHIAMARFRKISYNYESQTVDIGAGLLWADVYAALEPYEVSVAGGDVGNVGVAGLALGGGYGRKTNQYGLTMNNVFEYKLVTPNGTIVRVNKDSYPDIFFGLKGGFNNFGIVTNFNMRVVPQTQVYGGNLIYSIHSSEQFDELVNAFINFQKNNKDPKAVTELTMSVQSGILTVHISVYYDAPTAPKHIFKEFINIDHMGILKRQSRLELSKKSMGGIERGRFHTVSFVHLSTRLLNQVANQTKYYYFKLGSKLGAKLSILVQPFLSTYLDNSPDNAFTPRLSSNPLFPICIAYHWKLRSHDHIFLNAIQSIADVLLETMIDDGQYNDNTEQILYPNYAIETTPLSSMYGSNLPRLKTIRKAWDPENVMYLTGGWKF